MLCQNKVQDHEKATGSRQLCGCDQLPRLRSCAEWNGPWESPKTSRHSRFVKDLSKTTNKYTKSTVQLWRFTEFTSPFEDCDIPIDHLCRRVNLSRRNLRRATWPNRSSKDGKTERSRHGGFLCLGLGGSYHLWVLWGLFDMRIPPEVNWYEISETAKLEGSGHLDALQQVPQTTTSYQLFSVYGSTGNDLSFTTWCA